MDAFYSNYRDFTPDPTVSLLANFDALVLLRKWAPGSRTRTAARNNFRNAMIEQFNATYGTDAGDLASWQNLCRVVRIAPVPESITQCKKVGIQFGGSVDIAGRANREKHTGSQEDAREPSGSN